MDDKTKFDLAFREVLNFLSEECTKYNRKSLETSGWESEIAHTRENTYSTAYWHVKGVYEKYSED